MTKTCKIIGAGRTIDFSEDGKTCMVRLLDEEGLPGGKVLTGLTFLPEGADAELTAQAGQKTEHLCPLQDHDIDTMARQNILYNSYMEVEIV